MSRYINADNLIKKMQEQYNDLLNKDGYYDNFTQGYGDALSTVENEPTADVQKVKHAKNLCEDYPSLFQCSLCNWCDDDTTTGNTSVYNYCPNCGAKIEHDKASNMNKL